MKFQLEAIDPYTQARASTVTTLHGEIHTPVFMPVATHAAMRGQSADTMRSLGYEVLLGNTYHLLLRPGPEVFKKFSGIHRFMNWGRAVLTDSGGFQIFSMSKHLSMSEEGATFRSYVDGKYICLTPELSIQTQGAINSDIMMVLDQCVPSTSTFEVAKAALELTYRWAKRSLNARGDSQQALFGIVQGACYESLRRHSAEQISSLPFDGFALGGLAVGESKNEREDTTQYTAAILPTHKPRYLMGVGTPIDLVEAVARGIDMFDCILPTSLGSQGVGFTSTGKIDLRRGVYKFIDEALDRQCDCVTCKSYSKAYLHHLAKAGEHLCGQLVGFHNLSFYKKLMSEMRSSILEGTFKKYYDDVRTKVGKADDENPPIQPKRKSPRKSFTRGDYEVVTHSEGVGKIRQVSSGETMHSVSNPKEEAEALYVNQSGFRESVSVPGHLLIVWDVGLGAASNAMAFVGAYELEERPRECKIISFESDLDSLKLALQHPALFQHLNHPAPHAIANEGKWLSKKGRLSWDLLEGDFLSNMTKVSKPDVIVFDPFSYKTDGKLWQLRALRALFKATCDKALMLFTYSSATRARAAFLAAGFHVAKGVGIGPKVDTTVVCNTLAAAGSNFAMLDTSWLQRWERSDARHPEDIADDERGLFEKAIREHPQFRKN